MFALASGLGLAFALARALAAWRAFRRFKGRLEESLLLVERNVAGIDERMATADRTATRLAEAQTRLRQSLATVGVLADALGEARALLGGVRGSLPGK
jgi:hypothetical protein